MRKIVLIAIVLVVAVIALFVARKYIPQAKDVVALVPGLNETLDDVEQGISELVAGSPLGAASVVTGGFIGGTNLLKTVMDKRAQAENQLNTARNNLLGLEQLFNKSEFKVDELTKQLEEAKEEIEAKTGLLNTSLNENEKWMTQLNNVRIKYEGVQEELKTTLIQRDEYFNKITELTRPNHN